MIRLKATFMAVALTLPLCATASGPLSDDEIDALLSRPSIALYKAYAEFKMADYANARRIWLALAERDVAEAWFNLGILAEDGLGQTRDPRAAIDYYRRGAAGGSPKAQYRLALLYLEGRLLEADRASAEHWLERAAAAGHDDAARQLEQLRAGVKADDYLAARLLESEDRMAEAVAIYMRLADQGEVRAQTRLAWLYEAGRGVPRDLARAAALFGAAAARGDAEAQFALSVMLRTGAGMARDDEAAAMWLTRAARAGHPEAVEALERQRHEAGNQ
ncbi:MAG TPA: tetratricopeptide repeat protein [Rhodocyclaceae bacterium]|nr:tetratricopeptide repeat protein [Rhodocyclaceae bacterium]